jgi:predicted component of type VI protein secretion system
LPDPQRYVSAHHARVQFREGHFYLQDVSTNGVYVNDDMEPLGKRGSSGYRIENGDVLRIGDYHIIAALERHHDAQRSAPAAVPTGIHALRTLGRTTERDIGVKLNLEELLVPVVDLPALPVSAYGQPVDSGRVRALAPTQRGSGATPPAEPAAAAGGEAAPIGTALVRLAEAVSQPKNSGSYLSLEDVQSGLDAFCRGAGVAQERLPAEAQGAAAASGGTAVPRGAGGIQGDRAQPRRDAQPLPHRVAAARAGRSASLARRLHGRGSGGGAVPATRGTPPRLGAMAARYRRRRAPP